jgi:SAM-dependent methyltransferase
MADHASFAPFNDDKLMGDPGPKISRVLEAIDIYLPGASSLLELGCGTGAVLAGLAELNLLVGIDRSREMLSTAREKIASAQFVEGDLTEFAFHEHFDVIICVYDTLNHLPTFDAWQATFLRVADHLATDGLFLFEVNTIELGVKRARIKQALAADFDLLEESDPDGRRLTDESARAYYVYRRCPR